MIAIIPRKKILVFKREDKRLVSFETEFDGNRIDCRTSIRRSGNGSKPGENTGDTPATTAIPRLAERARRCSVAKPTPQMLVQSAARYRAQPALLGTQ